MAEKLSERMKGSTAQANAEAWLVEVRALESDRDDLLAALKSMVIMSCKCPRCGATGVVIQKAESHL
jgi:hypothetical protein